MTRQNKKKREPLSRKAKKAIAQVTVLAGGLILLTLGTLVVTGVFRNGPGTRPSTVTASVSLASESSASSDSSGAETATGRDAQASSSNTDGSKPTASQDSTGNTDATTTPSTESQYVEARTPIKPGKPAEGNLTLTEALEGDAELAGAAIPAGDANSAGTADSAGGTKPVSVQPLASAKPSTITSSAAANVALQTSDKATSGSAVAVQDEGQVIADDKVAATGSWMEMAIEANRDKIDQKDLDDFYAIIAKLDQTQIYAWADNGFTGEEQKLLISHLHARLNDSEYVRAKQLFSEYNFILDTL